MISKTIKTLIAITIYVLITGHFVFAQIKLVPVKSNFTLHQYWKNTSTQFSYKVNANTDTLHLPFLDDFSYDSIFPASSRWIDSTAYINTDFPKNPPSIGVATLDGLNQFGNAYDTLNGNTTGWCDELTSRFINLEKDAQGNNYDSVQMLFYVERRGWGNTVEPKDSLNLDFWDVSASSWVRMWSLKGSFSDDTVFTQFEIKINTGQFLTNGFRFRFRNYGSKSGNQDHWHIDYVLLRKIILNSTKNIDDVAWVYKGQSLLKDYSSIPWRHYKNYSNQAALMKSNLELTIHNINTDVNNIRNVTVKDSVFDENLNFLFNSSIGGANNYSPDTYSPYAYPLNGFTLPTSVQINNEGTNFYSVAKLSTNPDLNSENNVVVYKQRLYNYYAFDDGTAEAGLSMLSPFSSCAVKFNFLEGDTLRGIRVFWAQMGDPVGNNNLQLVVWHNIFIDSILYQQVGLTPDYVDSINGFAIYHATTPVYIPAGICYVGCIFTSANYYNLGVDRNTNNSNNNYYNFAGQWIQDPEPVALMIRPVVGDSVIYASSNEMNESSISVFPNPANNFLSISSPLQSMASVAIINQLGSVVFNQLGNNSSIQLPDLENGMYIVRVTTQNGGVIYKRIIISK